MSHEKQWHRGVLPPLPLLTNPGWLLLSERHQDITGRLDFADNTVDVAFAEHVIEHVPFGGG